MWWWQQQEREEPKKPHSRTLREIQSLAAYLHSPDGIKAQDDARRFPNDISKHRVQVPHNDGSGETFGVSHIQYYRVNDVGNTKVWFDQYNDRETHRCFMPKYEVESDRTPKKLKYILYKMAYAMATTTPPPNFKSNRMRHAMRETKKFVITNLEEYLPDGRSPEWIAFVGKINGTYDCILYSIVFWYFVFVYFVTQN